MSIETSAWAFKQKTGSPLAKLILVMMAERGDMDGVCIIEPHIFAGYCDMTLDELREGLKQLLHYGFIERVASDRISRQTQVTYQMTGGAA